jgi:hypothetical protein
MSLFLEITAFYLAVSLVNVWVLLRLDPEPDFASLPPDYHDATLSFDHPVSPHHLS